MIRIAAVGDVHYGTKSSHRLRSSFSQLKEHADIFMIAGDLTQSGTTEEAAILVEDLAVVKVPVVVVLGNHDYHQNQQLEIHKLLQSSGVYSLEGNSVEFEIQGRSIGIVGLKGFGGGFFGACVTEFGEPEMKLFAHYGRLQAEILRKALESLSTDYKFVLLHFSPVEGTLHGERREIYPFLGSYLLAEAVDSIQGVNAVFHGHAHLGVEKSETPGGVPVWNVAQRVIQHAYQVYEFR